MSFEKISNKLALIGVDFDIWSGQARLRKEDLRLGEGGEIPPERLAQLGTKRICDPKALRPFNRLKTRARRLVLDHGRPFIGGFIIPRSAIPEIEAGLETIRQQFIDATSKLVRVYESAVEEWAEENAEYGDAIRRSALTPEQVRSRFGFDFQILSVEAANEKAEDALKRRVRGVSSDLLREIVERAGKFVSDNLGGRDEVSAQSRATLVKLHQKVAGLSFLNKHFGQIKTLLSDAICAYPASGQLSGDDFTRVLAICLVLSDQDRLSQYLKGDITLELIFDQLKPKAALSTSSAVFEDEEPQAAQPGAPEETPPPVSDEKSVLVNPHGGDLFF